MTCLLGIVPVLGIVVLLWLCEKYDNAGPRSEAEYRRRRQIITIEKEDDDE